MTLCTAVQEGCGYKDTLRAHRYFAPLAKYFTVCITYQPAYIPEELRILKYLGYSLLLVLFASNYRARGCPWAYLQGLLGNDWGAGQTRNTSSTGGPFVDEDRLRAFLKRPCAQRAR